MCPTTKQPIEKKTTTKQQETKTKQRQELLNKYISNFIHSSGLLRLQGVLLKYQCNSQLSKIYRSHGEHKNRFGNQGKVKRFTSYNPEVDRMHPLLCTEPRQGHAHRGW